MSMWNMSNVTAQFFNFTATKLYVHFNRKIDTIECSYKMGIEPLNHLELPKPVDNLKPLETIWNQLKPPETFQKVPETTWNRLKPATLYFFFYLRYSQVVLVLILHPKVFFGQNLENFRFWNQICPKNVNDKNFGKINIKFEMRI